MKKTILYTSLLFTALMLWSSWGFFGHRRINRMAVFTLPSQLISFYKKNIEYVTEHAVDPDKRRYATKHEAVRHYIDIDHWGGYPFEHVPRDWPSALTKFSEVYAISEAGDSILLPYNRVLFWSVDSLTDSEQALRSQFSEERIEQLQKRYKTFFRDHILPSYFEDLWPINPDSLEALSQVFGENYQFQSAIAYDRFSGYGILPYNLIRMQRRLTDAFFRKDIKRILQLSADFGHYIGDAHVPLHTTENYNGQFTDQIGIHAFWESRIPELFADRDFDFFVGKAQYIKDPQSYYWKIVLDSHTLLDSVLLIEKQLSHIYPGDQQYCYEERSDLTIRTQCRAYAAAYNKRMGGMVEERMRAAILAIGDAWYTAWVDAGQPRLSQIEKHSLSDEDKQIQQKLDQNYQRGEAKGREHN